MSLTTEIDADAKERLRTAAQAGRIVVFFGAGVSKEAGFPSWKKLIAELIRVITLDKMTNKAFLPSLEALSNTWHLDVLDVVKNTHKPYFRDKYRAIFPQERTRYRSTSLGQQLALLDARKFVTLNYDLCFQASIADIVRGRTEEMSLRTLDQDRFDSTEGTLLCQIHGSAEEEVDDIILTKTQYNSAYRAGAKLPAFLNHVFRNYAIIIVGYGFNDDRVNDILSDSNAYSAQPTNHIRLGIRGYELGNHGESPAFKSLAKHQWSVDVVDYSIVTGNEMEDHSDVGRVLRDIGNIVGTRSLDSVDHPNPVPGQPVPTSEVPLP